VDFKRHDPVLVWVGQVGPGTPTGMPVGARVLDEAGPGVTARWVDVCTIGQHLTQRCAVREMEPLDAEAARAHGLCPDCLGYGAAEVLTELVAPGIDQVPDPCPTCTGTGRPAMRMQVTRSPGGVVGNLTALPHEQVHLEGRSDCMACGLPPEIHPPAEAGLQGP
jgi:hypothetical protein